MKLEINPRGNGACPLCSSNKDCRLKKSLVESMVKIGGKGDSEMEIVVYSCSYFIENA